MKCPECECEDTLFVSYLYQYSRNHKITKDGKLSKNYKNGEEGPMDCAMLCCTNGCEINESVDWYIDEDNNLIIRKWGE